MTDKTKEVLIQVACYAAVGAVVAIGPILPLTACLVCVGGSVIFAYLYKCMQGQPLRAAFLICALLWLWGNTAVTLVDFTNAPLAITLLVLGCVLVTGAGRWARLGAFLLPVGALSLIPYGLRDWESAMAMAACAGILYLFGALCYLSRTFITRNKWLGFGLPCILFTALVSFFTFSIGALSLIPYGLRDWESAMVMAACAGILCLFGALCFLSRTFFITRNKWLGYGLPYILFTALVSFFTFSIDDLSTRDLWAAAIGILFAQTPDLCAILSRRCMQACGMQNPWWLGTCSALSCLAPLGALNFFHNIEIYFLKPIF